MENIEQSPHFECGYGWIVVTATFFVNFIADGLVYSFGILLVELLETFKQDRASTVVIGSILFGFMYIIGPLAGALSKMYGCRVIVIAGALISCCGFVISYFATSVFFLYFSYGLLGGVGLGLMFLPAGVCVIQHFSDHRAAANGIACCGTGVGTFVMSHFSRYLLDTYSLRGTILLHGGLALQGVVLGLFVLPPKRQHRTETENPVLDKNISDRLTSNGKTNKYDSSERSCFSCFISSRDINDHAEKDVELAVLKVGSSSDNEETGPDRIKTSKEEFCFMRIVHLIFDKRLLTNVAFWAFLMCNFTVQLAYTVPFNLLPDEAVEKGIRKLHVSWLMSSIGVTNTFGRLMFGWLADLKCVNRLLLLKCVLILSGVSTAVSLLLTTFETKILYTCVYGLLIGGYVVLCPVVLADLFGTGLINQSFGLWLFVCGLAGTVASPIGGWLFDMSGSYNLTFIVAGAEFVLGGLILLIPNCLAKAKHEKINTYTCCFAQ